MPGGRSQEACRVHLSSPSSAKRQAAVRLTSGGYKLDSTGLVASTRQWPRRVGINESSLWQDTMQNWMLRLAISVGLISGWAGTAAVLAGDKAVDSSKLPPSAKGQVDFVRDIQPLFAGHCYKCHGPKKQKS